MTRQRKYPLTDLSVAPARARHRALIDAAVAWQAGRAQTTDPDHFALICAATGDDRPGEAASHGSGASAFCPPRDRGAAR
jgi:hypothetical protein